jgi:replicative DNA helicase
MWDEAAERYVLGCAMWTADACAEVIRVVSEDDFAHPDHRQVFVALRDLFLEGKGFDPVLVADRLRMNGSPVDRLVVVGMLNEAGSALQIQGHLDVVLHRSNARRLDSIVRKEPWALSNSELEDAASRAEDLLRRMRRRDEPPLTVAEAVSADLRLIEEGYGDLNALSTGFTKLDDMIDGGFLPGQLIVLGAATSMGKTAMIAGLARAASRQGARTLMCTLEMPSIEIRFRLYAQDAGISLKALRASIFRRNSGAELNESQFQALSESAARFSEGGPIEIADIGEVSAADIAAEARRTSAKLGGLDLIAVDYLQLMKARDERVLRYEQVGEMARALKLLARELNVPVVVGSQLNRKLEMRDDKRPRMSDLRESGDIENHSDVVLFLYRPSVYEEEADPKDAEIIIGKNRNGESHRSIHVRFVPHRTLFHDPEDPEHAAPAPAVQTGLDINQEGAIKL